MGGAGDSAERQRSSFGPVTAPFASFAVVTAPFLILAPVTALPRSCGVPTLFLERLDAA